MVFACTWIATGPSLCTGSVAAGAENIKAAATAATAAMAPNAVPPGRAEQRKSGSMYLPNETNIHVRFLIDPGARGQVRMDRIAGGGRSAALFDRISIALIQPPSS